MKPFTALLVVPMMFFLSSSASAQRKPKPLPEGFKLQLKIDEDPKRGLIARSVFHNESAGPVVVLAGYDGRSNVLYGQGKTHRYPIGLWTRKPAEPKRVIVEAGEKQTLFELPLQTVLLDLLSQPAPEARPNLREERPHRPDWGWDWRARSKGPPTPFHVSARDPGLLLKSQFWATTTIEGNTLSSEKVPLQLTVKLTVTLDRPEANADKEDQQP